MNEGEIYQSAVLYSLALLLAFRSSIAAALVTAAMIATTIARVNCILAWIWFEDCESSWFGLK